MRDTYSVEEVPNEQDKNIVIRLKGEGISYMAQNGTLSVYLDEKTADSVGFHLLTIIEDRQRRKEVK
jgi:hypothetical protein